jgi:hypothetical protein
MKAVIFAGLATGSSFFIATVMLRYWKIERRARALLWVFVVTLGAMIAVSVATPSNLMILPDALLATPPWFDLVSSVFFFAAAFFGGILQIYNLADRGLSLRILIDLHEQPNRRGTVDSLYHGYGGGKGIGWMYRKRLDDMVRNGLITIDGGAVALTSRGRKSAGMVEPLRRFFKIGIP